MHNFFFGFVSNEVTYDLDFPVILNQMSEPIINRAKPTKRNTKKPRLRLNNSDQLGIGIYFVTLQF